MMKFILYYFLFQLVILAIFLLLSKIKDKRYKNDLNKDIPEGFQKTDEVSIDPVSGKKLIVFYNNDTGDRIYREGTKRDE